MQGHVDAVGEVVAAAPDLRVTMPADLLPYVVVKGSITVDGVSLTVVDRLDGGFTVAVIPHTADVTTLGRRRPGDRVNLEVDLVAKYVESLLAGPRRRGSHHESRQGGRRHRRRRRRRDRGGRRRRGQGERGRPHHGGGVRLPRQARLLPSPLLGGDLRSDHPGTGPRARTARHGPAEHREPAHRVPGELRLPAQHHDRHLGLRPGRDDRGPRRPGHPGGRPGPARARVSAAGQGWRGAAAGRAHRGGHRPGPAGRDGAGGRAGRDRRREEDGHGQGAGAGAVLRPPRTAHDLDRRPGALPPPDREARAPHGRGHASRPNGASSAATSTNRRSTTPTSTWPW